MHYALVLGLFLWLFLSQLVVHYSLADSLGGVAIQCIGIAPPCLYRDDQKAKDLCVGALLQVVQGLSLSCARHLAAGIKSVYGTTIAATAGKQ